MRLQQKSDSHWLSRQRQAVLLFSSIFALISGLSSPAQAQVLSSRRQLPRIAITPSSATVTTGKAMNFKIAMLDAAGKPAPAGSDLAVQLTLTSMPKLDAAKKQISVKEQSRAEQKAPQLKALNQQMIKLASGQTFSRLEGVFTKGQSEITLQVLVQQTGQIRLFAESGNFQPGEAVLIAVSPAIRSRRYSWNGGKSVDDYRAGAAAIASSPDRLSTIFRPDSSSEPQPVWRRAAWQDTPPGSTATAEIPRFKLELNTPGVQPRIEKGEWVADFSVALKSVTDSQYLPAPEEIRIIMKVLQGAARFDPTTIKIKASEAISETFFLRSRPGGKMELAATPIQTGSLKIEENRVPFEFQPGTRATHLRLTSIGGSALANNLDEVVIEVRAVQLGADNKEYVIRAEDESLSERRVSFSTERGFGVRFEQGNNQVTIPQGQESGRIKLFSSLPADALRISAESTDGLQGRISGEATVSFQMPVWPIIFAIVGGLIWGFGATLLRKTPWAQSLFRGGVGGFLFYVIVFFGALLVSYSELSGVPLDIARLPTASWLAALVIGLLGAGPGSWLIDTLSKHRESAQDSNP